MLSAIGSSESSAAVSFQPLAIRSSRERNQKQGHPEFSDVAGGGLAGAEITGGAGTRLGSASPEMKKSRMALMVRNRAGGAAPEF